MSVYCSQTIFARVLFPRWYWVVTYVVAESSLSINPARAMAAALRLVRGGSCTSCSSAVSSRPCAIPPVSAAAAPSM